MKRSIPLVIIFLILLLLLELGYTLIKQDHVEEYVVDNYNVHELFRGNSYYLSIDNGSEYYKYQTDINYNKTTDIVEKILTYSVNNYKCIYPIYKENVSIRGEGKYNDIECFYNGNTYTGDSLQGVVDLSGFKTIIKNNNASYKSWEEKEKNIKYYGNENIYLLDLSGVYFTIVSNDNSHLYISSKTIGYVEDFPISISRVNDVGLAGTYFFYPSSGGQINRFGYVEIISGVTGEISSDYKISINSYANGVYKNELYIYDLDLDKQFKVSRVRVNEVTKDNTSLYYDGEKSEFIENSKFRSGLYFDNSNDGNLSYFVKDNNLYKVYNGDKEHPVIIYRGNVQGIKAKKNYVMFSVNKDVYVYSDTSGLELVYKNVIGNVDKNKYDFYVR